MRKRNLIFVIFLLITLSGFSQNFDLGQKLTTIPENMKLIGISSKDYSKIYRFQEKFPTTVFAYTVDNFEIKVHNNIIVSLHFILNPKDKSLVVPTNLIEKIKSKSGNSPVQKQSKYYFDDISSKTVVFRQDISDYNGDKIHIMTTLTKYLQN